MQNYVCFSPLTSGLASFSHKSTPSDRPWIEAYCQNFQLAWKWAGPRMPKGQLSRVSWSGNSWKPFTFQPALRALQQPHKQSHSLQLATDTELAHHSLSTLSIFLSKRISSKYHAVTSKHQPGHLKGLLATSKWHALLVYSGCRHGEM